MSYPIFLMLAIAVSWVVSKRLKISIPAAATISRSQQRFICLIGFSAAVFFAKLPFWIFSDQDLHNSGGGLLFSGKTILLGLVGGYAGVEFAKWHLSIKTKTGDRFAVPVAVGVGIGRLGCFFGGCCYGVPTELPWGFVFQGVQTARRHPTQLYEVIFHLSMAAVMYDCLRRNRFPNQLIKLYFISYFLFRFATEAIRPEIPWAWGLTGYQWAIVFLLPIFAWLWRCDAADQQPIPAPHPAESARRHAGPR